MENKMYHITCTPECGFMLRSHDKDEVKKLAKEHVKTMHKMDASDADLEKNIKVTKAKSRAARRRSRLISSISIISIGLV